MDPSLFISSKKPWVLVDRIIDYEPKKRIVTSKNISNSDFYLMGHFSFNSIYPGALQVEGVIQSIEVFLKLNYNYRTEVNFLNIQLEEVSSRFYKICKPGDTITYHLVCNNLSLENCCFKAIGYLENEVVLRCNLKLKIMNEGWDYIDKENI